MTVDAMLVQALNGSRAGGLTQGAKTHALLDVTTDRGRGALAIPATIIEDIVIALSTASSEIRKASASDERLVMPVHHVEVGSSADGKALFLGFDIPGGGRMSFAVPMELAALIRDTIAARVPDGVQSIAQTETSDKPN